VTTGCTSELVGRVSAPTALVGDLERCGVGRTRVGAFAHRSNEQTSRLEVPTGRHSWVGPVARTSNTGRPSVGTRRDEANHSWSVSLNFQVKTRPAWYSRVVDPKRFNAPEFGKAEREPGNKWAFWYFKPEEMPRDLVLEPATVDALSEADAALGQLQGLGRLIRDPELLLGPYITREAVASSRIEGTETSLSEVLQAEAGGGESRDEDVAEVERYVAATRHGLRMIQELPISRRLVCEVHRVLLDSVRGKEKLPGEFRKTPVWVGSTTDSPDTATFVPPLPDQIPDLFADWEQFVNEESRRPVLVRAALMHYQLETIHPFLDGNGRIGRLMIGLLLIETKRLPTPLLYLSGYLETHRREYYDRLQAVRERGEIQEWLQFFLTAVKRQAEDASQRATKLVDLRETYLDEASKTRSSLPGLVAVLFRNPYVTVSRAEHALTLTNQGARNLIRDAERRGWLTNIGTHGRGGKTYWVAQDIFSVIEAAPGYGNAGDDEENEGPQLTLH
jgi:Fic family protein